MIGLLTVLSSDALAWDSPVLNKFHLVLGRRHVYDMVCEMPNFAGMVEVAGSVAHANVGPNKDPNHSSVWTEVTFDILEQYKTGAPTAGQFVLNWPGGYHPDAGSMTASHVGSPPKVGTVLWMSATFPRVEPSGIDLTARNVSVNKTRRVSQRARDALTYTERQGIYDEYCGTPFEDIRSQNPGGEP
ncbi:MAG: hypothetical protein AAF602_00945 [Myxococcota bacterium]